MAHSPLTDCILHVYHGAYLSCICRDVAARNCMVMQNLSAKITGESHYAVLIGHKD